MLPFRILAVTRPVWVDPGDRPAALEPQTAPRPAATAIGAPASGIERLRPGCSGRRTTRLLLARNPCKTAVERERLGRPVRPGARARALAVRAGEWCRRGRHEQHGGEHERPHPARYTAASAVCQPRARPARRGRVAPSPSGTARAHPPDAPRAPARRPQLSVGPRRGSPCRVQSPRAGASGGRSSFGTRRTIPPSRSGCIRSRSVEGRRPVSRSSSVGVSGPFSATCQSRICAGPFKPSRSTSRETSSLTSCPADVELEEDARAHALHVRDHRTHVDVLRLATLLEELAAGADAAARQPRPHPPRGRPDHARALRRARRPDEPAPRRRARGRLLLLVPAGAGRRGPRLHRAGLRLRRGARAAERRRARSRCRASATATSRRSCCDGDDGRAAASRTRRTASCSSPTSIARAARELSAGRACSRGSRRPA